MRATSESGHAAERVPPAGSRHRLPRGLAHRHFELIERLDEERPAAPEADFDAPALLFGEPQPRGALAHWIVIKDRKIENYQLVVPSTWNASPRDAKGQRSAYEASLIGTPVHDPKQPLEIIRTIHSFDPCLACAVHLYEDGAEVAHHELLVK